MKTIKRIELKVRRERLAEPKGVYNTDIHEPNDVAKIAASILDGVDQEVFLAFPLDAKNKVLGYVEVARGCVDLCPVDPREIFRAAIVMGASAVIIVHNHPSGDSSPSPEDMKLTERVCSAGTLLGIPILDHLVVSEEEHTSFAKLGLMPTSQEMDNELEGSLG